MPAPAVKPESAASLRLNPKSKYVVRHRDRFVSSDLFLQSIATCAARPTTTKMKQLLSEVLQEKLEKATYQSDRASALTKEIADVVKARLKGSS